MYYHYVHIFEDSMSSHSLITLMSVACSADLLLFLLVVSSFSTLMLLVGSFDL